MSSSDKIKFAVMFPGQGSQYIGMGKGLYGSYFTAKKIFNLADEILNFPISSLCFKGDIAELTKTKNAQVAIFLTSYVAYQVYVSEKGLQPAVLLGHSLGEITALACSGAINFKDALKIVKLRGEYMFECGEETRGSMLAIMGAKTNVIKELCGNIPANLGSVEISNYNSERQTVVSGRIEALGVLKEKLKKEHLVSVPLNVSAPFHSKLMKKAAENLGFELNNHQYNDICIPTISNVTGTLYSSKNDISKNLTEQITKPVQWVKSVKTAYDLGINLFVETGPKHILKALNKDICRTVESVSLDLEEDCAKFNSNLVKYGYK